MFEILENGRVLVGEAPATAWRRITGSAEPIVAVERIKKSKRARVYRLDVAGRPHPIIAKRCREKAGVLEHAVYTQVLADSSLRAPAFYGFGADPFTDDEHTYYWVFVEDLGSRRHDPASAEERRRLAHWLGAFHAATAGAAPASCDLPVRHAAYYKALLDDAVQGLPHLAAVRDLPASLTSLIDGAVEDLRRVEAHWPSLEALIGPTPRVVAHGDCVPKNIHAAADGALIPIDWGSAGIGIAGFDLGASSVRLTCEEDVTPDIDAYVASVRPGWPDVDASTVTRLAYAGRVLWVTKLIAQTLPGFHTYNTRKVDAYLSLYAALLKRATDALLRSERAS